MDLRRVSGYLASIGTLQFLISMAIAESLYPGYSVHHNYISDLGVGSTAPIFNTSIVIFGVLVLISGVLLLRALRMPFTVAMIIAGLGAAGVGLFPEGSPYYLHTIFSLITFMFGGITAIFSYRVQPRALAAVSAVMGATALVALVLYVGEYYAGLGPGGMERMIAYPVLFWALMFGGYLVGWSGSRAR
ncbi:MAG: DUF998 domain-containing protein [Conexivisphaerales archaeon]|nr:DUF998 domain-containing protein [Conexivisphaerales archaeon]